MTKPIKFAEVVTGAAYLNSLSLMIFLRHRFGERVMGDLFVACGFSGACFWCLGKLRRSFFPTVAHSVLTPLFLWAMLGLTVFHQVGVWWRRRQPMEIHSYSTGEPFPFWRCLGNPDAIISRYLQPVVCGLIAFTVSKIDRALGFWIGAASVIIFIQEQKSRISATRRILDAIDNRIASQKLLDGIQARLAPPSKQPSAPPVVEMAEHIRPQSPNATKIMERLDPALRQMLDQSEHENNQSP